MRHITLSALSAPSALSDAKRVISRGGVMLFPTDTLYGLGADAFSDEAVDKIYAIKGRDERKPIHCIVADLAMAELYAHIDSNARALARMLLPGGLTLILKKRSHVTSGIARGMHTIGIRIPNNAFCLQLAAELDRPFTATSANLSDHVPLTTVKNIAHQLGEATERIDLALDAGELPITIPSTVVDLSGEQPFILREGIVPTHQIWDAIGMGE